jgi:hypothetical protein
MKLSLRNAYLDLPLIEEGKKKEQEDKETGAEQQQRDSKYSLQALYLGEDTGEELAKKEPKEEPGAEKNVPLTPSDEAFMDAMEQALEKAIDASVSLEEGVQQEGEGLLNEKPGVSAQGFAYEDAVIDALIKAKTGGNIKKGAGASSGSTDADMNIFGKIFNVEIKLNSGAQMGGSSVRYNKNGEAYCTQTLEEDTEMLLLEAIKKEKQTINKLLGFLAKQDPRNINKRAIMFPLSCTKNAWDLAQQTKLLLNIVVPYNADFIADHYARKGIYYIQIGGAGLFYMKANPATLPIPRLQGSVDILIRSARNSSRRLSSGIRVVSAGIRVQGRLRTKNTSPYTIDDPASIQAMLATVKNSKIKK